MSRCLAASARVTERKKERNQWMLNVVGGRERGAWLYCIPSLNEHAACNSNMMAHFAIEVAAMFPLVPDNDCLKRAYTFIYSIYSVGIYLGVYMHI